jgi:hypothetical protein
MATQVQQEQIEYPPREIAFIGRASWVVASVANELGDPKEATETARDVGEMDYHSHLLHSISAPAICGWADYGPES